MKRVILVATLTLVIFACKKQEIEPLGPTDVRIRNITDKTFENVIVNTSGGENNFGTIPSGTFSSYYRYEKTYPHIDISLTIEGVEYSTPKADYTYQNYIGQVKCTYEVFISDVSQKLLDTKFVYDSPLEGN